MMFILSETISEMASEALRTEVSALPDDIYNAPSQVVASRLAAPHLLNCRNPCRWMIQYLDSVRP